MVGYVLSGKLYGIACLMQKATLASDETLKSDMCSCCVRRPVGGASLEVAAAGGWLPALGRGCSTLRSTETH